MTILEAIAAALIRWLAGWLDGRSAKKAAAAQEAARDKSLHEADTIRDTATKQEDAAHVETQSALDRLADDRDQPASVQSVDVNKAIDATNGDVR